MTMIRAALKTALVGLLAVRAAAQSGYTLTTGTISSCYANGSVQASWINQSGSSTFPNLSGSAFPQQATSTVDSSANIGSLTLADVAQVVPGPFQSQWKITVCAKGGSQPLCYSQLISVTGNTPFDLTPYFVGAPIPNGCNTNIKTIRGGTANGLTTTVAPTYGDVQVLAGPDANHVIPVNTGPTTLYLNEAGGYSVPPGTTPTPQNQYVANNGTTLALEPTINFIPPLIATNNSGANRNDISLGTTGTAGTTTCPYSVTTDAFGRVTNITGNSGCTSTPIARTCNANGCYQKDADGTVREWGVTAGCGSGSNNDCSVGVTLPYTFPASLDSVTATGRSSNPTANEGNILTMIYSPTTSGFTVRFGAMVYASGGGNAIDPSVVAYWTATGH